MNKLMKNKMRILFLLVFTILISISSAKIVVASDDRDYQIRQNDIYVKIYRDGSAEVAQQVHYHFKGGYNGVFIIQDAKGLGKISDIQVSTENRPLKRMLENKTRYFERAEKFSRSDTLAPSELIQMNNVVYQPNTGADGEDKKGDYRIITRVSRTKADQTVTYYYHLSAVAKRYLDTGEINWKIIGNNWQRKLKKVNITIEMPRVKGSQQLWVHGVNYDRRKWNKRSSTVKITAKNVDRYLEVHMLFPSKAISKAPLHHHYRVLNVTKVENRIYYFTLFTNANLGWGYLLSALVMIIPFFVVISGWLIINRHNLVKRDRVGEKLHRFDIPTTTALQTAAIYQEMSNDDSGSIPFATEIADLQLKGKISVKDDRITWRQGEKRDDTFTYYLVHEYGDDQQTVKADDIKNSEGNSLNYQWLQYLDYWRSLGLNKVIGKNSLNKLSIVYLLVVILVGIIGEHLVDDNFSLAIVIRSVVRLLEIIFVGFCIYVWKPFTKLGRSIFRDYNFEYSRFFFNYLLGVLGCFIFWVVTRPFSADSRSTGELLGLSMAFIGQPLIVATFICGIVIQLLNMLVVHFYLDYSKADYQKIIEILQFKRMVHDMGHFTKRQLPEETLWGEYYVYATAVGETKSFIRALSNQFGEQAVEKVLRAQLHGDRTMLENNFINSALTRTIIDHANRTYSSSGSDGSFSGGSGSWGSSGGSGGDSGGGAF